MLEGNPSLHPQACVPAASSPLQPPRARRRPLLPTTAAGDPGRNCPAPAPLENASPKRTTLAPAALLQHKAPPARPLPAPRPRPARAPRTARARAEQQAREPGRRPRGEPSGERAAGETSRVPGAVLARAGQLTRLGGPAGTPSAELTAPAARVGRARSRVAGEPEPAAGQPRCAPTRLPEAAGLREAVTPAGRAGQSGARPSRRRDGTTGVPASWPAWVTDSATAAGCGAGSYM